MTVRDPEGGRHVAGVVDRGERGTTFRLASSWMSGTEVSAVGTALDGRIGGGRIGPSAWIPGSDRRGTPKHPIHDFGERGSVEQAALMFGLFVWEAFDRQPADWSATKFSAGGSEDRFRVYFGAGDE